MIHVVRHGETEWSLTRRHTGTTDIDLTERGRRQAEALQPALADLGPVVVWCSPRRRALDTARLAGFADHLVVDERLVEWDYGEAEGRTTEEIQATIPGWNIWTHPLRGGESLDDVAGRADEVIADLRARSVDTILFAHAHFLRVLAARWCDLPAGAGANLLVDPASIGTLGVERSTPCIVHWNLTPT